MKKIVTEGVQTMEEENLRFGLARYVLFRKFHWAWTFGRGRFRNCLVTRLFCSDFRREASQERVRGLSTSVLKTDVVVNPGRF